METHYQHKILGLEEDLAEAKSDSPDEDFNKDGKGYGFKMRVLVYECLVANVPTGQIPGLIDTFARGFNIKLKGVPGRSTVENMVVELGLISDFQVAAFLYNSRNVTIAFDATTQDGTHVNEIHATTKERCLVMSLEELVGGTAQDYANHIIQSVEHLAQTLCTFRVEEQSISAVNKTLQSHITCSMTDRAAANHAAIRIVNEAFKTTLLEVNCHLHPLDTIATKCRSTLKLLEHGIEKSKLFGHGCRAEKVILALNKMRFKDGKGDPHGFRAFLRDYKLPQSLVIRYRGNRLHVVFKLAATYICHYEDVMTYLKTRCLHNSELKTSLIEDFADPETKLQLQVLAVLGKMLTGPWMKLFYRSQEKQLHHMDAFDAVKSCYSRMEFQQSKKEIVLEEITTDFFGNAIDCTIDKKVWLPAANINKFSVRFKAVLTATMSVIQRQYQRYYAMEVSEDVTSKLESARTHNMDSEEVMGMFSAGQSRAPRATLLFLSSKIRAKKNKTLPYLLSHPEAERRVMQSVPAAAKLRRQAQTSAAELQTELSRQIAGKMQKKKTIERRKLEDKVKQLLDQPNGDYATTFPSLDSVALDTLQDIVKGAVVKRKILHLWAEEGHFGENGYNGKIEKLKGKEYTICYWGVDQTYEDDGEDYKVLLHELVVDFICGDVQFMLD